ncbi:hypothetical protein MCHK_3018 [Mesorhizobium huakuii 7653R]|nr:hypothetical protein MCHK_3018 [Mesorhizobium huakuii 7653R]
MRHSRILALALAAGGWTSPPDAIASQLYAYARERKFPSPETLARKGAELAGSDFPFASLAEAPEPQRVFFTAFRTVLEALEPFREEDPAGEVETSAAAPDRPAAGDEFVEVEIVFRPLGGDNLVYVQAQTRDGERKQVGFWTADGEHEALLLTVHKSDVRDLPPVAGDFGNDTEAGDNAEHAQDPSAAPVDEAAAVSLDPGAVGGADAAPVPDAGSTAPAEAEPAATGKNKKKTA